jgi:hypothetical protein
VSSLTPSQRTKARLAEQGYHPFKTEHWNAFSRQREDLFGIADFLALGDNEVIAVQTTTADNLASRVRKIAEHPNVGIVREAGIGIHVHGWYKSRRQGIWVCNIEDVS